jgi:peptidoglycan/LPS O-acetylase OafA/YrhL
MSKAAHYPWLDVARGVSALLVVAGHCRAAFFPPLSSIASPTLVELAFYAVTSLGSLAVMAFFVLSGFLVGGSVIRAGERFRLGDYFTARLCRLWVVLIPALLLTLVADTITARSAPSVLTGAFFEQWHSGPDPAAPFSTSLVTFLGNVAFLQKIFVPVFGTNGPLWSLSCEFWYYVIFPFITMGLRPAGRFSLPVAAMAAFATVYFMPPGMLQGFYVWLMGVLAFVVSHRLQRPVHRIWIVLSCTLLILAIAYDKSGHVRSTIGIDTEYVLGVTFSILVITIAHLDSNRKPIGLRRLLLSAGGMLSRVSYSLYLCHFPLLVLIAGTFYPTPPGRLSWQSGVLYALVMAFLCGLAGVFWLLFERHTDRLRTYMRSQIESMSLQQKSLR